MASMRFVASTPPSRMPSVTGLARPTRHRNSSDELPSDELPSYFTFANSIFHELPTQ